METNLLKCPACDLELPEDDLRAQSQHLQAEHPDLIDQRRRTAGFVKGPEGRWHDAWASD